MSTATPHCEDRFHIPFVEISEGFHVFRRYRLTWFRKNPDADLERFWMGRENEAVGDDYSKMKEDVAFRLEQAETVGLGFALPPKIAEVVLVVRK